MNEVNETDTGKDDGIEDMKVTAPQEIGSHDFKNKDWDQASRASYRTPKDLEQDGAAHLTKRRLAFFTGKTYLGNF